MTSEQLRDKCVPCSPSAHGAQALVDRPPLESLLELNGTAPDYDYAGVDGPAGRTGPAASFWASRTAHSVLKSGTTIQKLAAGGGWPAALEIHFGGSCRQLVSSLNLLIRKERIRSSMRSALVQFNAHVLVRVQYPFCYCCWLSAVAHERHISNIEVGSSFDGIFIEIPGTVQCLESTTCSSMKLE